MEYDSIKDVEAKNDRGSCSRMILAGIIANLPGLSAGLSMGFSAILIPQLQKPDSDIPITLEQGSWIASLFVIGDLLGCTIGGPIADRFGRRFAILLDCLPLILGWILTWQSSSLEELYVARTITGVGIGAGVPIVSMYLREISTPELRGTLTILMPAAANIGNLLMYGFGYLMAWRHTTIPGFLLPLLPIFLVFLLPETPIWLLKRRRREDAIHNLAILRGKKHEVAEREISKLEELIGEEGKESSRVNWKLLIERPVIFPMCLLVFLFFTQSFSGSNMVSYYTVTIFQMAKIPINENLAAILVAAQYVFGYTLSSCLVTRFPRRSLLFFSLCVMGTANMAAGIVLCSRSSDEAVNVVDAENLDAVDHLMPEEVLFNQSHPDTNLPDDGPLAEESYTEILVSMIPVISCIFITFGYGCGLGPVPFILFGELFPSAVRGTASSITAFLRSITVFLSIKIFPSLLDAFGIGGSFFTCAVVCFAAIGISYLTVPETKGLDTVGLENIYKKQNKECRSGPTAQLSIDSQTSNTSETKVLV